MTDALVKSLEKIIDSGPYGALLVLGFWITFWIARYFYSALKMLFERYAAVQEARIKESSENREALVKAAEAMSEMADAVTSLKTVVENLLREVQLRGARR